MKNFIGKFIPPFIINSLWMYDARKGANNWIQSSKQTGEAQLSLLRKILSANAGTDFGREYGFYNISDYKSFNNNVPIQNYDTLYDPWLKRVEMGENKVLTTEDVFLFEPTSGSTRNAKLIPYTKSLKKEFTYGIDPWIYYLFKAFPKSLFGSLYWSITPASKKNTHTLGGIPIGFEDDAGYLNKTQQRLFTVLSVVPKNIKNCKDYTSFKRNTLWHLLSAGNLGIISIWNPTYLFVLLKDIKEEIHLIIEKLNKAGNVRRANELKTIINRWKNHDPQDRVYKDKTMYELIWPRLQVISCWADAFAKEQAEYLHAHYFPNVSFQAKGLLSTEAFISFPIGRDTGSVLSLNSHFFEFITEKGDVLCAHELKKGIICEVVVTTSGGLYRYRTNDLVEVIGFRNTCPVIRFLGKKDKVVDLVGEKLNETHVQKITENIFKKLHIDPEFWMLAPHMENNNNFYILFVEGINNRELLLKIARILDKELQKTNVYYNHARNKSHQLDPISVFHIKNNGAKTYLNVCMNFDQSLGNIKPSMLHKYQHWDTKFIGNFL